MRTFTARRNDDAGSLAVAKRRSCWLALAAMMALSVPIVDAGATAPVLDARPLVLDLTGWADRTTTFDAGLPLPAAATNIGPGSHLLITKDGAVSGCTANFIWSGTNGKTYLGAAGHCFLPDAKTATHGPGADYDPAGTTVRVCVADCNFGGRSSHVITGTLVTLGPLAYARQIEGTDKIGHDFGLVEIPSNLSALLRPSMPVWGGPTATTQAAWGKVLCHYGNGVGVGEVFPTMARMAVATGATAVSFVMAGAAYRGDSGSAVETCTMDSGGVDGQDAVGILTHLSTPYGIGIGNVPILVPIDMAKVRDFGYTHGTTVAQAISMATQAGLTISLVAAV